MIIQPLHPRVGYSPTLFWTHYAATDPVAVADFDDGFAKLVNVQEIHSLDNTSSEPRLNIQLCFAEPFEEVKALWEQGKLFSWQAK